MVNARCLLGYPAFGLGAFVAAMPRELPVEIGDVLDGGIGTPAIDARVLAFAKKSEGAG
jgi:hypothetical protein